MGAWHILGLILAIGLPLLLVAGLMDRRYRRRMAKQVSSPPPKNIPNFDESQIPSYINEDEIFDIKRTLPALDEKENSKLNAQLSKAFKINCGWANSWFATNSKPARAIFKDAEVLLIRDKVNSFREILPIIQYRTTYSIPLVIVCPKMELDILRTLLANYLKLSHPILVVYAHSTQLIKIAEYLECLTISQIELQAGYIPKKAWGHCKYWISDDNYSALVN